MTTALETVPVQIKRVKGWLEQNGAQFSRLLPRLMPVERFLATVMSLVEQNPSLLECSKDSLIRCILQSAQLGLLPGPRRQVYFVPFNNKKKGCKEVQLIIGYQGLLTLCRNSGEIAKIEAQPVFEGDEFGYTLGLSPTIMHVPKSEWRDEPDARKAFDHMTHVYAFAKLLNRETQFVVMTKKQIEGIRDRFSKAKDSGPWVDHPIEMSLKCPLRELANLLPSSDEKDSGAMAKAVALDKQADADVPQTLDVPLLADVTLDDTQTEVEQEGPRFQDWYGPMAGRLLSEGTDNHLEQYLAACKRNVGAKGREGFLDADKQVVSDVEAEVARRKAPAQAQAAPATATTARAMPEDFAAWCNEAQEKARDLYYDLKDRMKIKSDEPIPVAKRQEFVTRFNEEYAAHAKKQS